METGFKNPTPDTPPAKNMEYLERTMETLVFYVLVRWKWLGTNRKQVLLLNATLTCSFMDCESMEIMCVFSNPLLSS